MNKMAYRFHMVDRAEGVAMWSYETEAEGNEAVARMNEYKPGWGDTVQIVDSGEPGYLDTERAALLRS